MLATGLGNLAYFVAKRRVKVVQTNLQLCFPELSKRERNKLARKSLVNLAYGGVDTLTAWLYSDKRFNNIAYKITGAEHLTKALATGKGVLLCSGHFTCLEVAGRLFGKDYDFDLVYQKHKNLEYEKFMTESRSRYVHQCLDRYDVRGMIRSLKQKRILWIAPDQDLGDSRSVFVPFFGVQTATVKVLSKLAKLGDAVVVPAIFRRSLDGQGYELIAEPHWEDFPSGDDQADAARFNALLEKYVRQTPEQYLWAHRRFKTRPPGEPKIY